MLGRHPLPGRHPMPGHQSLPSRQPLPGRQLLLISAQPILLGRQNLLGWPPLLSSQTLPSQEMLTGQQALSAHRNLLALQATMMVLRSVCLVDTGLVEGLVVFRAISLLDTCGDPGQAVGSASCCLGWYWEGRDSIALDDTPADPGWAIESALCLDFELKRPDMDDLRAHHRRYPWRNCLAAIMATLGWGGWLVLPCWATLRPCRPIRVLLDGWCLKAVIRSVDLYGIVHSHKTSSRPLPTCISVWAWWPCHEPSNSLVVRLCRSHRESLLCTMAARHSNYTAGNVHDCRWIKENECTPGILAGKKSDHVTAPSC